MPILKKIFDVALYCVEQKFSVGVWFVFV